VHVGERELDHRAGDVARLLEDAVLQIEGAKQLTLPGNGLCRPQKEIPAGTQGVMG
jgi:hypothetical protein